MMGHVFLAALASLLVVVNGQAPPEKCCLATKYTAEITDLSSINNDQFNILLAEFDLEEDKQALLNLTYDPATGNMTKISRNVIDFKKGMGYYVPESDPSKCYKYPYTVQLIKCIPDDAKYMGSSYLGSLGGQLAYDGWRFTMPGSDMIVTIAMSKSKSKKNCVPILESIYNPKKPTDRSQNFQFMFTGYKEGIQYPDIFKLPDSCFQ